MQAATQPPPQFVVPAEETEVYTAGACAHPGKTNAHEGCGIWFGQDDERNNASELPGQTQLINAVEIYAIKKAARKIPPFVTVHIVTAS